MIATRKDLDETDHKIIQYIKSGFTYKYIAHHLHFSIDKIKYRIRVMKKEYNCKSLPCLIAKLS